MSELWCIKKKMGHSSISEIYPKTKVFLKIIFGGLQMINLFSFIFVSGCVKFNNIIVLTTGLKQKHFIRSHIIIHKSASVWSACQLTNINCTTVPITAL